MIYEAISALVAGRDLTREAAAAAMTAIMDGAATPAQTAAFITALAIKGETIDEITGCAQVMRSKATRVHADEPLVDTCGTGGDGSGTFNISTAAALVTAGAGVNVAKHGNRAASSKSGSADVLAELGVNLDAGVPVVERCIAEAGIGFMFAPRLHGAMKHAMGARREIGIRTIFNILGPLTNPASARNQVLGVFDTRMLDIVANVLKNLGSRHVYVVCGADGLDEITTTAETSVAELRDGRIETYRLKPEDLGVARSRCEDLTVGTAAESAAVIRSVLEGKQGPARDIVVVNAAAAVAAGGRARDLAEGVAMAKESVDSGAAAEALAKLAEVSNGG